MREVARDDVHDSCVVGEMGSSHIHFHVLVLSNERHKVVVVVGVDLLADACADDQ